MTPRFVARWLVEWRAAVLLGVATIGAYGVVQYAIGVLVPAIGRDTQWSTGTLAAAFSVGVLLSGPAAVASGYTLDRIGSRPVLLGALAIGATLLSASSWSTAPAAFVVLWGLGAAAVGGGLYYPVTMAAVSRLYPRRRAAALSVLTLLGALASPLFYPLAGALIELLGWRAALRALVAVLVMLALPAALFAGAPGAAAVAGSVRRAGGWRAVPGALAQIDAPTGRLLLTLVIASAATSALMLHHVAALQAAGLSLAVASGFAGARGLMQIPGRLVLAPAVRVLGLRGSLGGAYVAAVVAAGALWIALVIGGAWAMAVVFAIAGGFAVGLQSPLNGLLAAETYGDARLGTLSGVAQLLTSLSGAAGAWLGGTLADARGGFAPTFAAIAVVQVGALVALRWQTAAARGAAPARADGAGPPRGD